MSNFIYINRYTLNPYTKLPSMKWRGVAIKTLHSLVKERRCNLDLVWFDRIGLWPAHVSRR